ncbi:MAG: MmgE/PrpD family protein, partial [Burkholderiales bacterium]|nr:MmgE/PrpD family protein [Burkholderiales bacterium]
MAELTGRIADFVSTPLPVPADVANVVRRGFIDTVATMLAGRGEPVVQVVRRWADRRRSTAHEASVLFGPERAASADAALINATSAHALDYDDV